MKVNPKLVRLAMLGILAGCNANPPPKSATDARDGGSTTREQPDRGGVGEGRAGGGKSSCG